MADAHYAEWAGAQRPFRLRFGDVLDLEEACGKVGVGALYLRMGRHEYFAKDVYHTILRGLIGGGMAPSEARRLVDDRFDHVPMATSLNLAVEILVNLMAGIEPDDTQAKGDPDTPHDTGGILASFAKVGIPPESIRAMSYADFVNMARAMGGKEVQPPSEDEFLDMIANLEG